MHTSGCLLIVTGPAGAGKDTIVDLVVSSTDFRRFPTYTSRKPRQGEVHGVHYIFTEREHIESMSANGELFEPACGHHLFGFSVNELMEVLEKGNNLVIRLAPESAVRLKCELPESFLVAVIPPSPEKAIERMAKRGMTKSEMGKRLLDDQTSTRLENLSDLYLVSEDGKSKEVARRVIQFLKGHKNT